MIISNKKKVLKNLERVVLELSTKIVFFQSLEICTKADLPLAGWKFHGRLCLALHQQAQYSQYSFFLSLLSPQSLWQCLYRSVPYFIGNLILLTEFDLHVNNFSGSFPLLVSRAFKNQNNFNQVIYLITHCLSQGMPIN